VGGFVDGSVCENEQNFGVAAQHPAKIDARLGSLVGVDHLLVRAVLVSKQDL
jgi:hypothetical protein